MSTFDRASCPICFDWLIKPKSSVRVTNCGHIFHESCIRQCLNQKLTKCPCCREQLWWMRETYLWTWRTSDFLDNGTIPEKTQASKLSSFDRATCPICFDWLIKPDSKVVMAKCGHVSHESCALQCQIRKLKKCPCCPKKLKWVTNVYLSTVPCDHSELT